MNRIKKLSALVFEQQPCYDEFYYKFHKAYAHSSIETKEERYGDAFYCAFSSLTPQITPGELIVGKCTSPLFGKELEEWENTYKSLAFVEFQKAGGGQDSHMAIDYELLLELGIEGIIKKIEGYQKDCDPSQMPFYDACKKCLEAVIVFSESYSQKAKEMAAAAKDATLKEELEKIAEICKNVPKKAPKSFYEAVQSVHFVTLALSMNPLRPGGCQQFQLGRPDRYLLPFYLEDIKSGVLTKEKAQELLDCLGIQINNRVINGLSSGYMVGGRDEKGEIAANDLTLMCMQVIADIGLVYPSVGLCYAEGMDDLYLEKACEILSQGFSHPAIFNDNTVTNGLVSYGVPKNEACNYIHSTCVEITPVASSNVWVASPYTNMAALLIDNMNKDYQSFDELLKTLMADLDKKIEKNFENEMKNRHTRRDNSQNPLLSCFVNDCLKKGTDIERGGAKYNWIMPSFVGMANLVDSLFALKKIVFDQKEISVTALKAILDKNFEGEEALRLRLLNSLPKYGNDIDEIDSYFGLISDHIANECKKYTGDFSNANLIPSVFCWIMHERFGSETGATPDGRQAGFPLGDGSGPCQGREANGPTSSIISSTKWDHSPFIGGVAVNMKFSKQSLGEKSLETMKNLVKVYLKRGGFEIQINVADRKILEKAIVNPEQYRDLVVRIGGYSDYFVKLSPNMQKEVMLRTEHKI